MAKQEVRLVVSYKINDLKLFETVAAECCEFVSRHEEGTLAYDWYVAEDKASGKLFEVYRDKDAFETHLLGPVFTEIGPKFKNAITWLSIDSFGPLPEVFYDTLGALPNRNWPTPHLR